ncbi:MAG: N-formylglutamate amidohydrolase [Planctomycetes bacterium]|nr:N-formylglutamate amidohydrolase [Planctomycetota bacterium]
MDPWDITIGDGPLVAAAIHNGGAMRAELRHLLAISEADRLREEDPYTGAWTVIAPNRVVGLRSRFEVDLNRPREKAVYVEPKDSWGLRVWKTAPPDAVVGRSQSLYDTFYQEVEKILQSLVDRFGRLVVYDLHSYNHRRLGPDAKPDDPASSPDVNVGTGTMDRQRWEPIVDRFLTDLRAFDFLGRRLDVRENVKFFGGEFAKWIHGRFPSSVCVLSIEFKKFFMDEWSGELDPIQSDAIGQAVASTVAGVLEELQTP